MHHFHCKHPFLSACLSLTWINSQTSGTMSNLYPYPYLLENPVLLKKIKKKISPSMYENLYQIFINKLSFLEVGLNVLLLAKSNYCFVFKATIQIPLLFPAAPSCLDTTLCAIFLILSFFSTPLLHCPCLSSSVILHWLILHWEASDWFFC